MIRLEQYSTTLGLVLEHTVKIILSLLLQKKLIRALTIHYQPFLFKSE